MHVCTASVISAWWGAFHSRPRSRPLNRTRAITCTSLKSRYSPRPLPRSSGATPKKVLSPCRRKTSQRGSGARFTTVNLPASRFAIRVMGWKYLRAGAVPTGRGSAEARVARAQRKSRKSPCGLARWPGGTGPASKLPSAGREVEAPVRRWAQPTDWVMRFEQLFVPQQ